MQQHDHRFFPALLFLLALPSACVIDEWHDDDNDRSPSSRSSDECRSPTADRCPNPSEAEYLLESPELCSLISFSCEAGKSPFTSACGCGCVDANSGWSAGQPTPGMGPTCPPEQEGTFYLSRDEQACRGISVTCAEGLESFSGPCGCGCQTTTDTSTTTPPPPMEGECPSPEVPGVRYLCEDPVRCEQIEFSCPEGEGSFRGPCGCGCIASTSNNDCPDPNAPGVLYVNPDACESIDFSCPEGCVRFDGACGCGCIEL